MCGCPVLFAVTTALGEVLALLPTPWGSMEGRWSPRGLQKAALLWQRCAVPTRHTSQLQARRDGLLELTEETSGRGTGEQPQNAYGKPVYTGNTPGRVHGHTQQLTWQRHACAGQKPCSGGLHAHCGAPTGRWPLLTLGV